jgi:hypothetical protein
MDAPELDLQALAQDWVTLWHSELAALSADPEAQETWRASLALWATWSSSLLHLLPGAPPDGGPAGRCRSPDAPRPAAPAAAPDARDAEIDRLARHVAELERRLARLETP